MTADVTSRPLRTSESIAALAAALAKAQAAFVPVRKDKTAEIQTKTGGRFSYQFVDLATIVAAIRGPLSANELAYTQAVSVRNHRVCVETTLMHASGEWLSAELELPIADAADARAIGSSITYGRRFGLTSLVGIAPGDEDDDGEAAGPLTKSREEPAPRRARATLTTPPPPPPPSPSPSPTSASPTPPASPPAATNDYPRLTERQMKLLHATKHERGWSDQDLHAEIERAFGVESIRDLHRADLNQLLNLLERRPRVRTDTK